MKKIGKLILLCKMSEMTKENRAIVQQYKKDLKAEQRNDIQAYVDMQAVISAFSRI
jgi:hypothetical protein